MSYGGFVEEDESGQKYSMIFCKVAYVWKKEKR